MNNKAIFAKDGKVVITDKELSKWKGGVIITCQQCGKEEIVSQKSLCDLWKLCRECATKRLKE